MYKISLHYAAYYCIILYNLSLSLPQLINPLAVDLCIIFISVCVWGFVLGRRRLLYNLSTSFLLKYFTQHFFVQWCIVLNNCINKVSCRCFFPNTDMSLRCFSFMSQIIITDLIIKSVELVKTYRSHFVTLFLEYYFHCNTGVLIFTITARWRYSLLFFRAW